VTFRDHFSGVATGYARYRPGYPGALFDWLAGVAPRRELAWDCACGSGQAARPLASRFARIVATDASLQQLANASPIDDVSLCAAAAEAAPLAAGTVDLVTVGQALHWFDLDAFAAEVRRVLVPGGVVAAWTYGLPRIDDDQIDAVIHSFIDETLGPYWPPETEHVLDGYASLVLPFAALDPPPFVMTAEWSLSRFLSFTQTWSGVARFIEARGDDPVDVLADRLAPLWDADSGGRTVRWTLKILAGMVEPKRVSSSLLA
jgi:SAM-dependent methyltransferase